MNSGWRKCCSRAKKQEGGERCGDSHVSGVVAVACCLDTLRDCEERDHSHRQRPATSKSFGAMTYLRFHPREANK